MSRETHFGRTIEGSQAAGQAGWLTLIIVGIGLAFRGASLVIRALSALVFAALCIFLCWIALNLIRIIFAPFF